MADEGIMPARTWPLLTEADSLARAMAQKSWQSRLRSEDAVAAEADD
jgi:hypothetical protein